MKQLEQLIKLLNHPLNKNRKLETFFKVVWWKINQIFFKIPAVIEMTKSAKLVCYPNSSYGSFVVYANFPEYEEMNFINKIVVNGDIVFDVGANIGSISILTASSGENVKVFAFEPTEKLIPLIHENIAVNHFEKRITVVQKAVSNTNGFVEFIYENECEINHIATNNNNQKAQKVACVTIDSFVKEHNISHINFLKIDVEGAELFVFKGASKSLSEGKIDIILFEVNKSTLDFGYKQNDLIRFLKNHNFFVFQFEQNKLSLVTDNFSSDHTTNLVAVLKQKEVANKIKEFL